LPSGLLYNIWKLQESGLRRAVIYIGYESYGRAFGVVYDCAASMTNPNDSPRGALEKPSSFHYHYTYHP